MFADVRETAGRAQEGVNVVNIEGTRFDADLVKRTADFYLFSQILSKGRTSRIAEVIDAEELLAKFAEALKRWKICFEMKETSLKNRKLDFLGKKGEDVTNELLESQLETYRTETDRLVLFIRDVLKQRKEEL